MHPILARAGRLGPYLFAWIPLTGILASFLALAGSLSWAEAAALSLPLALVYAFLCLSSWYLCRVLPLKREGLGRLAGTVGAASLVAGALWVVWGTTVASVLGFLPLFATLPDRLAKAVPVVFLLGVLLYLLVVALHYVLAALEAAAEHERRETELKGQAREAELKALKDQLNPHFLFNSLNSISALTASNPERAREMCLLLADFLRRTLGLSERSSIPLKEELALARTYLAVEKVRFGDRLVVEEELDPAASECPVPPLLLQPLVENAVKHGISPRVKGGSVRLSTRRSGERVEISVENPFEPAEAAPRGAGLGLANVRKRVLTRYGGEATVRERLLSGLFRVEVSLPAEG